MVSGHRIANAERARLDDSRAMRWRPPTPQPFDDVRAKIVTDLAGLLILLSMIVGSLIALG